MEAQKELKEKDLKKEFSKDFYRVDYLSELKINRRKRKEDISAIIPTYNRCPFDIDSENYEYNPLSVCINALLLQKSSIKEIIVIDDASTDNTKKVVEKLAVEASATKGIEIKYFYNTERKGSSVSRNIGAKCASGKYLYFLDDDCVPTPHLSFIAMIVIKKLEKIDKKFAALVLPVYDRASFPKIAPLTEDLTKSFLKRGTMSAYFNSIPLEYLTAKDRFLNKTLKIFKPIQVYQTWGHFIIDRSKYLDVGGFPDFATWANKAGEEQEFACRLIENTYTLYYLPENKASSFHGAFGAKIGDFDGFDWLERATNGKLSLIKYSKICDEGIMSGNRVGIDDYCYSRIIAPFCIIYKRNTKEAINWARTSYEGFVTENKKIWYPTYAKGQSFLREKREKIWHTAISDGLNLLFNNEQKKLMKLDGFIQSLKNKGNLEDVLKNLKPAQPKVFSLLKPPLTAGSHPQEDYFIISKKYPIYVVADGVSLNFDNKKDYPKQSGAGEVAKIFCETVVLEAEKRYENFQQSDLKDIFNIGNKAVKEYNVSHGRTEGTINYWDVDLFSATTSFALIKDNKLYWWSLCDSGVLLCDKNGKQLFASPNGWGNFNKNLPKNWQELAEKEKILLMHKKYRNALDENGKSFGYGIVDGEETSQNYLSTGVIDVKNTDFVVVYTDGFENFINLNEFTKLFSVWPDTLKSKLNALIDKKSKENSSKYGREKTLIAISI